MKIVGLVLFVLNIAGLIYCIYTLQVHFGFAYLCAAVFFIAQIVYLAKTLKLLKRHDQIKAMLDAAIKKCGLSMTRILSDKKSQKEK
jgi:uncharacterized protein YebE (UPF0316 family)